ncbi:MAG: oxidoreductase [Ideonella sp. MAG2]|nr:MAG: oxidoreductase [Ideonella sp. MAG2]
MSTHPHPVRVGLIGFGFAGRTFHAPLLRSTPGLHLVAVASSQPALVHHQLGAHTAVWANPEALIASPDIDLVVLASPNDSHFALAQAALQAHKAVVVDKPFTLNASEAQVLVQLAESRRLFLSVFHNRRWDGDFLTLQALLAQGTLGRVVRMASHFDRFRPQVRPRWREAAGPGGGLWIDLAPHLLDQALQCFGPPAALYADIATLRDGAEADDWFACELRYDSGLRVHLSASTLAAHAGPRFVVHGSRGSYRKWGLDAQEDALRAGLNPDPAQPEAWGVDAQAGELSLAVDPSQPDARQTLAWPTLRGDYPQYYAAVVAALQGRGPHPVPPRQALAVMHLLDLGRESARRRVELACPAVLCSGPTLGDP